jgi:hypothetical protein
LCRGSLAGIRKPALQLLERQPDAPDGRRQVPDRLSGKVPTGTRMQHHLEGVPEVFGCGLAALPDAPVLPRAALTRLRKGARATAALK